MAKYGEHSSAWELGQTGGGRGSGPWPGLLAAGEGEGSPGGAGGGRPQGQVKERSRTTVPSAGSQATCKTHFPGTLLGARGTHLGARR